MLQHLSIQNFTIITTLDLEFKSGMTVLTGETGAGKSILVDALLLTLGGRTDSNLIQPGHERCSITATFALEKIPVVQQWLSDHDLASETECLLRRTINSDGRSRGFINGQAVPIQQLRELGNLLINIHGQHEHQTLLKPEKQRALLDAYAKHLPLVKRVQQLYTQWQQATQELSALEAEQQQRTARHDFLSYQINEFTKLALQPDELKQLDTEQKQLANAEQILTDYQKLLAILNEQEDANALDLLNTAQMQLQHLQSISPTLSNPIELLNNAIIQVEECLSELEHHFEKIELNPERLKIVEERLTAIHDLARKHRVPVDELFNLHTKLATELEQLANSDIRHQQLQTKIDGLKQEYSQAAQQLSQGRHRAAERLTPLICASMQELNMTGGQFAIKFTENLEQPFSPYGLERVEFYVSANPGQPLQPLAKVASGGELSRISLAIHVLTAQIDITPTLIFDEVDVGIGGGTAEIVGRLLRKLGETTQVLCVTHLPQVAAQGHQHLQVGKTTVNNITATKVHQLDKTAKIQEIARMLGGVKITKQTLAHASEMLEAVID